LITAIPANSKKLSILPEVSKPVNISVNQRQLFISDSTVKVHIYSMKDFKYLKQISRKGEGPGECNNVPRFTLGPDYIFLYSLGKCLFFSRDGEYLREFKIPRRGTTFFTPVGENFIFDKVNFKKKKHSTEASIYTYSKDKELKEKKLIYCYERPLEVIWKGNKRPYRPIEDYCRFVVYDNKVFIGDTTRGLFVEIYDSNGNKISQVKLNSEKRRVPEQYKKEHVGKIKKSGKWELFQSMFYFDFPEYFPSFFHYFVDNGKVYFLTSEKKDGKRKVVVADWQGNLIKHTYVPWIDRGFNLHFSIENDKFYYITDNEESEEWELHVEEIK
jgi:hypothetical protein